MLTADPRNPIRKARDVLERRGITNGVSAALRRDKNWVKRQRETVLGANNQGGNVDVRRSLVKDAVA